MLYIHIFVAGIGHKSCQAPVIIDQPQSIEIVQGHKGILEVKADGTMPLFYQWHYGNYLIPGMSTR